MVKGVNKTVIEINETENEFFEKIIFFVSPKYIGSSPIKIQNAIKVELEKINCEKISGGKSLRQIISVRKRRRIIMFACSVVALIACAAITTIILI